MLQSRCCRNNRGGSYMGLAGQGGLKTDPAGDSSRAHRPRAPHRARARRERRVRGHSDTQDTTWESHARAGRHPEQPPLPRVPLVVWYKSRISAGHASRWEAGLSARGLPPDLPAARNNQPPAHMIFYFALFTGLSRLSITSVQSIAIAYFVFFFTFVCSALKGPYIPFRFGWHPNQLPLLKKGLILSHASAQAGGFLCKRARAETHASTPRRRIPIRPSGPT